MGYKIEIDDVSYGTNSKTQILKKIKAEISPGQFVLVLGENGAGKTSVLDLMMGFRKPTQGSMKIEGLMPFEDPWQLRQQISYLSEKVDIPGDWSVEEFFEFNRFFYSHYSVELEKDLCERFEVSRSGRLGNMSAGELRRVQIVGALSIQPKLIIVDEITAVLDIVGRRKFMRILSDLNKRLGCTIILATNIIEDLEKYASHILLIRSGQLCVFSSVRDFLSDRKNANFSEAIADVLEQS